jgi:hypothetical protein
MGGVDLHRLAIEAYLSRVCPVKTVQDLHERTFAGPVLPQQGMDLAAADFKIDVVIGQHAWKRFGNGPQGDQGG